LAQDFAYASRDINKNIKDVFDTIFAQVDKDIDDNIEDAFKIALNSKNILDAFNVIFVYLDRDLASDKDRFTKIVSIQIITNKNILEINNKIEDVLMLIIVNRNYIELDFVEEISILVEMLIDIISTIFFA